jgi:hypothetical protein
MNDMGSYKTLNNKLFGVLVDYRLCQKTLSQCAHEFQKIIEETCPDQWEQLLDGFSIHNHLQHYCDPALTALTIQQLFKEEN